MNSRAFCAFLLLVLGTLVCPVSCGGGGASEPPRDGDGGVTPAGTGGNGDGNAAGTGGAITGSAGTSGSGGTVMTVGDARSEGGSADAGSACQQAAAVDRTCAAAADCVVVTHQTDYIGQMRVLGIRSSEMAHFSELEKVCHATIKNFNLPGTTADDGSLVDPAARSVSCEAGVCTTFAQACAQPCAAGHICITCGTGATAMAVCSQLCVMGSCTEAPRTSCLGGASLNGGEGDFCFDPRFAAGFMSSSCHR